MRTRMKNSVEIWMAAGLVLAASGMTRAGDFTWAYKTPMPHGKGGGAAAAVGEIIYVIGGHTEPWTWPYGRICEAYNTSTDSWIRIADLPHPDGRYSLSAIGVSGKVYTVGGTNIGGNYNNNNIDEYNPATNTWIANKATLPVSIGMPAMAEYGGKIYIFGGGFYTSGPEWWSNNVYEYNPVTNAVTAKSPMPTKRACAYAGTVGGQIFVIGGEGGYMANDPLDAVEAYDPGTDSWATGYAPMPVLGRVEGGVINNMIYVHVYSTTSVYEYDAAGDTWTAKNPIQTARAQACVAAVANKLYMMGGFVPGNITPLVEEGTLTIEGAIDIDPETLNVSSRGKWVTCYIEFPEGCDVMDIDGSTVKLEDIPAYIGTEGWARAGANSGNILDHDGDGMQERMVKFDGSAVRDYLLSLDMLGDIALTVTGELVDGPSFEGLGVVRITQGGN